MKILGTIVVTVLVILGISKFALKNFQTAVIHQQQLAQSTSGSDSSAGGHEDYVFDGDLSATMPKPSVARSTPAEDEQRAREAASCVRVIFDGEAHPRFVELVKAAFRKQWNPKLGYQLVFEESRGPLEEQATAVTLRAKVQTYTASFQQANQPDLQPFFNAVELIAYNNPRNVPTSWDLATYSASKPLPQQFSLGSRHPDEFNRQQLGYLYQAFSKELNKLPAFAFFPQADFDAIRDLYVWPLKSEAAQPAVEPRVFSQTAERLVKNSNRPLYKGYLDAIACHLLTNNATAYVDGIAIVLSEWLPHVQGERLQLLRSNLSFADYALMKTLLRHRQGYLLFKTIPEVWTDPGLAEFSRDYWREKQKTGEQAWLAREFADKLAPAAAPAKTPHMEFVTAPQSQPTTPALTPPPFPVATNRLSQIPPRTQRVPAQ
jgi:hypothetical protein